ncbi:MAG: hypothetical protein HC822_25325 [Oscillochloris sp.]|nr:hypothetical protein [Oscillochloris sp.]
MAKHPLAMALAKVVIAAAWADGHMDVDEVNSFKRLLAELGQTGGRGEMSLTANEWAELEIYLYSPVSADERARLTAELAALLRGPRDREMAMQALDSLLRADRVVTDEERGVADEIRAALLGADVGFLAQLGRLLRVSVGARAAGPNREQFLDEFLHNRIYYAVRQRLGQAPDEDLGISAAEARVLALAGGLLAYVARVDQEVTNDEFERIRSALAESWGIDAARSVIVAEAALAEVSAGLDFYRLTKSFADSTSIETRARFVDALFAVAAADGEISSDESAEISRIVASINLTHDHFVAARRRISASG